MFEYLQHTDFTSDGEIASTASANWAGVLTLPVKTACKPKLLTAWLPLSFWRSSDVLTWFFAKNSIFSQTVHLT